MGRILILLGILAIVGGIFWVGAGVFAPLAGLGSQIQEFANPENIQPQQEELCEEGETLDQVQGPSVYTPGQGSGRPTQLYCVDGAGNRRDVTGDFVEGLLGDVGGMFNMNFSIPWQGLGLVGAGFVMLIVGGVASRRSRMAAIPVGMGIPVGTSSGPIIGGQSFSSGSSFSTGSSQGGMADLASLIQQAQAGKASLSGSSGSSMGDLTVRLQELQKALDSGLITKEEYDRARQKILDELK